MLLSQIIKEYRIFSIKEFIDKLSRKQSFAVRTVYRGHRSYDWKLVPSLFRLPYLPTNVMGSWSRLEKTILEQFQKQAMPFLRSSPQGTLEWIALAQHHGLPTRLIDWTESPLTALFLL